MIATRRRVPVLFAFDVRDCIGANGKLIARSYGTELEGVFTRAGVKYLPDQNGLLLPRVHSMPPLGYVRDADGALVQGLLLETARTNLVPNSGATDAATWTKTRATVSANADTAPDGTLTADRLVEDTSVNTTHLTFSDQVTITANGNVCVSRFLKAGTRSWAVLGMIDATEVNGARAYFDLATGIVGSTFVTGGGTVVSTGIEAWGNGWYRCWVVGNLAGGITTARCYTALAIADADRTYDGDGTSYLILGGAQVEDGAIVPSSYIPTSATAVTRVTDSLYFDFAALPQEMTAYVRGIELGMIAPSAGVTRRVLHVGGQSLGTQPYFSMGKDASDNIFTQYDDGPTNVLAQAATSAIEHGDLVEHRGLLSSDWRVTTGYSVNGAAEVVSSQTGPSGASSAWGDTRIYLTGGLSGNNGAFAYQQVVVAAGIKTMDEMRALAGVA